MQAQSQGFPHDCIVKSRPSFSAYVSWNGKKTTPSFTCINIDPTRNINNDYSCNINILKYRNSIVLVIQIIATQLSETDLNIILLIDSTSAALNTLNTSGHPIALHIERCHRHFEAMHVDALEQRFAISLKRQNPRQFRCIPGQTAKTSRLQPSLHCRSCTEPSGMQSRALHPPTRPAALPPGFRPAHHRLDHPRPFSTAFRRCITCFGLGCDLDRAQQTGAKTWSCTCIRMTTSCAAIALSRAHQSKANR
jgi:hypothetical protein